MQWARYYAENSLTDVHDWLIDEGLKFMPAVNWVERGRFVGQLRTRYHIVWGTSRELTRCMIGALHNADTRHGLTILHGHKVTALEQRAGSISGAVAIKESTGGGPAGHPPWYWPRAALTAAMPNAGPTGPNTRRNRPPCSTAPTFADGKLHHWAEITWGQSTPPAKCGTTRRAFHLYPHFSRPWPVDHSVQIRPVAEPSW